MVNNAFLKSTQFNSRAHKDMIPRRKKNIHKVNHKNTPVTFSLHLLQISANSHYNAHWHREPIQKNTPFLSFYFHKQPFFGISKSEKVVPCQRYISTICHKTVKRIIHFIAAFVYFCNLRWIQSNWLRTGRRIDFLKAEGVRGTACGFYRVRQVLNSVTFPHPI